MQSNRAAGACLMSAEHVERVPSEPGSISAPAREEFPAGADNRPPALGEKPVGGGMERISHVAGGPLGARLAVSVLG